MTQVLDALRTDMRDYIEVQRKFGVNVAEGLAAFDAGPPGQLPLVAGPMVAETAGNTQRYEEERYHHRSFARDQAQVPEGGERVEEHTGVDEAQHDVGACEGGPRNHPQIAE